MPVVSRVGRIGMGRDKELSVGGDVLIPEGVWGGQWLNDKDLTASTGASLIAVDADTAERRTLHDYGANAFFAGGGVWASWVNVDPKNPTYQWGYCDSHGRTDWDNGVKVRDWHPIAVDDLTGTIVLYENGSAAVGVSLWDGVSLRPLLAGSLLMPGSFKDGEFLGTTMDYTACVWRLDGSVRVLPATRVWDVALSRGVVMGLYENSFLSVYREGETSGLILSRDGRDFDPDILTTTTTLVATSETSGERSYNLRRYVVDLDARTVNGQPSPWINLAAPLPSEPVRVPEFARVDHEMALAFDGEPNSFELTGIREDGRAWPIDGKTVGVLLTFDKDKGARYDGAITLARDHRLPLVAYWDGRGYQMAKMPHPAGVTVVPEIQAYPLPGESVEAFTAAIRADLEAVTAAYRGKVWVYGALYMGGVRGEQQVVDCASALWDLCREFKVRALTWFAWQRGATDGIVNVPSFMSCATKMQAACQTADHLQTAAPVVTPAPAPPTPTPEPPHEEPHVPEKPDISEFVDRAIPAWADRFEAERGVKPTPTDTGHIVFRTLVEGGAPEVMVVAPRPALYEYGQFLEMCQALATVFADARPGQTTWPGLIAQWGYQLLVNGARYDDIVADARRVA